MPEYFIDANSYAAPFVSDNSTKYVEADTPQEALEKFAADYKHPAGLYVAFAYESADDMHKGKYPLARWLSNKQIRIEELTEGKGSYTLYSDGPRSFELDGQHYTVEAGGKVVE
jgi:hypothetical protein